MIFDYTPVEFVCYLFYQFTYLLMMWWFGVALIRIFTLLYELFTLLPESFIMCKRVKFGNEVGCDNDTFINNAWKLY